MYLHPPSMAFFKSPSTALLLICCLFSTLLISALCRPGLGGQTVPHSNPLQLKKDTRTKTGSWKWRDKSERRSMIGSTAPICTYNECRGCRFKCSAEQVPVDASDPVNSAYRYRCVPQMIISLECGIEKISESFGDRRSH